MVMNRLNQAILSGDHPMNQERIFERFNKHGADYLLIGGMNMLLRHGGSLTYDVDLWIDDTDENRLRCHQALVELEASWGKSDDDWGPVAERPASWLEGQGVHCLMSPAGAIDIFRFVEGLSSWLDCRRRAVEGRTKNGVLFPALCDEDMLKCQTALPEQEQKQDRVRLLRQILKLP
jgi:hypothetical protein